MPHFESRNRKAPVVILLCHERTDHLRKVIGSLLAAEGFHRYRVIAVVDGDSAEVLSVLHENLDPEYVLQVDNPVGTRPQARILRSLRFGLYFSFRALKSPFVVVVEDDIEVASTFLRFVEASHKRFGKNRRYRGVNGFSREVVDAVKPGEPEPVVKLNYGLGWGWSITETIYDRMTPILSHPRRSDWHWDFAVEPLVRTGFVVNPIVSKVRNLGFDSSATHTSGSTHVDLGTQIERSFEANPAVKRTRMPSIAPVSTQFAWRQDCLNLARIPHIMKPFLSAVTHVIYFGHLLQLSDSPYVRDMGHKVDRAFRKFLFEPIFCIPRFNGDANTR